MAFFCLTKNILFFSPRTAFWVVIIFFYTWRRLFLYHLFHVVAVKMSTVSHTSPPLKVIFLFLCASDLLRFFSWPLFYFFPQSFNIMYLVAYFFLIILHGICGLLESADYCLANLESSQPLLLQVYPSFHSPSSLRLSSDFISQIQLWCHPWLLVSPMYAPPLVFLDETLYDSFRPIFIQTMSVFGSP